MIGRSPFAPGFDLKSCMLGLAARIQLSSLGVDRRPRQQARGNVGAELLLERTGSIGAA
jgi:hypothetical protein